MSTRISSNTRQQQSSSSIKDDDAHASESAERITFRGHLFTSHCRSINRVHKKIQRPPHPCTTRQGRTTAPEKIPTSNYRNRYSHVVRPPLRIINSPINNQLPLVHLPGPIDPGAARHWTSKNAKRIALIPLLIFLHYTLAVAVARVLSLSGRHSCRLQPFSDYRTPL